jgi:hypothetical protein
MKDINQALENIKEYPGKFYAPSGYSVVDIYSCLAEKGMVYWRLPDAEDGSLVIGFRPFNYDLDTSLLATLHH